MTRPRIVTPGCSLQPSLIALGVVSGIVLTIARPAMAVAGTADWSGRTDWPGAAAPPGGHAPGTVRNTNPERAVVATDEQWPAYYPRNARNARDARGKLGAGMEGDGGDEAGPIAEDLLRRFMNLHTAMRYEEALPIARSLVEAAPDRPIGHYNLACVLGRVHRSDDALAALERAVDTGWRNVLHTRIDPDLELIRAEGRFQAIIDRMTNLIEAERLSTGPLRDQPWEEIAQELADRVPGLLDRYHVPGASIALVRDGACVWTRAFGTRDRAGSAPVSTDTVFPAASPGHLLTLIAAAQLDAKSEIDLEKLLHNAETMAQSRDRDRSGGRDADWHVGRSRSLSRAFGPVSHQLLERDSGAGSPGGGTSRWPSVSESKATLRLLRMSVELSTGDDFSTYCHDRILAPLSMERTSLSPSRAELDLLCDGHSVLGTRVTHRPAGNRMDAVTCTTIADLARLMSVLMDDPRRSGVVLPETARSALGDAIDFGLGRLGLGVHAAPTTTGPRLQVADLTEGTGCLMRWYPESKCGVVVLFNSETGGDAALRIAAMALGGD